jgi:D-alanyl-D-alanine carboxypeptidase
MAAGLCLAASTLAISVVPASAKGHWRPYHRTAHAHAAFHRAASWAPRRAVAVSEDPAFSAIVVDANSGRELYGVNENGLRHPASITKVMTLYLLFEQLDKGALTLESQVPISEHAAAQEPSKLGILAGDSLSVEDAIKAVVTRSANDVAVAIAELVGHDEAHFAELMTRKAHALGMSRTIYRNASGLPNDEQITTARDLTVLARALEERFPKYFRYFSTHEFNYAGEIIGNHNHLLGRVDGVDGIKTGYTRASGFNLLTSVHRDGRSLVAVVMGGRTSGARDRMMEQLIADHIAEASDRGHTATMIADNEPSPPVAPMAPPALGRESPTLAAYAPPPPPSNRPGVDAKGEGDNSTEEEDEAPRPAAAPAAPAQPRTAPRAAPVLAAKPEAPKPPRLAAANPAELGWTKGPDAAAAPAKLPPLDKNPTASLPVPALRARPGTPPDGARVAKGGWVIQIGAANAPGKAEELLARARDHARSSLASATAVTEKTVRRGGVLYRARFAGLDSGQAALSCRTLRRDGFSCFATRD